MSEDNVRALREADQGKNILEPSQARILSEVSYHCWKRQFGQMDPSDPRKLKELERENNEPKKMVAEWVLKNSLLKAVAKKGVLYASQKCDPRRAQTLVEFRADGVPVPVAGAYRARPPLSRQQPCARRNQTRQAFSRGAALSGSHKRSGTPPMAMQLEVPDVTSCALSHTNFHQAQEFGEALQLRDECFLLLPATNTHKPSFFLANFP